MAIKLSNRIQYKAEKSTWINRAILYEISLMGLADFQQGLHVHICDTLR